ncbi:MAG: hypothetical protein FJ038_06945 [Chloroflexi bacterium]|nr:hypothetical protein [Chloroflexota bacterium]
MKTTLNINDDLYRDLKVEAARDGVTVQALLDTALRHWLERRGRGVEPRLRVSESPAVYRTSRAVSPRERSRPSGSNRPPLTREQVLARWRSLPSYDPAELRRDVERIFDTSL